MPIASVAIAYTNHVHNYAGGYHSAKMFLMVEWVTLFSHDVPTDLGHQPDAPPGVAKHDLNVRPSKFFLVSNFEKGITTVGANPIHPSRVCPAAIVRVSC